MEPFTHYWIEVSGHVEQDRLLDLGCSGLHWRPDGTTLLVTATPDQAALHGTLRRLRELGLPLLALWRASTRGSSATAPIVTLF